MQYCPHNEIQEMMWLEKVRRRERKEGREGGRKGGRESEEIKGDGNLDFIKRNLENRDTVWSVLFSDSNVILWMLHFIFLFLFYYLKFKFIYFNWRLITLQYCILPHINMNLPRAYTCSPSWTPLPSPCPYHSSGAERKHSRDSWDNWGYQLVWEISRRVLL